MNNEYRNLGVKGAAAARFGTFATTAGTPDVVANAKLRPVERLRR